MPKRLPPNNRPWPENLAYDFNLSAISPATAEAFIDSLATTDRNKVSTQYKVFLTPFPWCFIVEANMLRGLKYGARSSGLQHRPVASAH